MIEDILQTVILNKIDYYGCNNCELGFCVHYSNNNRICSGLVKNVNTEIPYDVIRLCIETSNEGVQQYDYTPDEVHSIISVLSHSVSDWLVNTIAYRRFRNSNKR